MKSSLTLIERFDIYCRAVLRSETKYYFYKLNQQQKKTCSLDALDEKGVQPFQPTQSDYCLPVTTYSVTIHSYELYTALCQLDERERDIVISTYYLHQPQHVIAKRYHCARSMISYYKLEALRKLRKWLEESTHEA